MISHLKKIPSSIHLISIKLFSSVLLILTLFSSTYIVLDITLFTDLTISFHGFQFHLVSLGLQVSPMTPEPIPLSIKTKKHEHSFLQELFMFDFIILLYMYPIFILKNHFSYRHWKKSLFIYVGYEIQDDCRDFFREPFVGVISVVRIL